MRSSLAVLALLATAVTPAAAHISLAAPTAKAGSHFVATFRIGHGCSGSPSTALRIELPYSIAVARPQPKAGWRLVIDRARLATPQKGEMGEALTARVSAITWKGGSLPADEFDEFSVLFKVPKDTGILVFPATQTCAASTERWNDADPKHPAPKLTVIPSDAQDDMAGMAMPGAIAGPAAAVTISDAWIRALPASVPSGGYFTLRNNGTKPLKLIGAASPACGMLMLHKSESAGGMARMNDVAAIEIPAHGTIMFAPGGYHLMCTDAKAAIAPGNKVSVTLMFADGSRANTVFGVRDASGH